MKLWALLLLALAGSAQASDVARYAASVDGRLTIGPAGEVLAVEFKDADWMSDPVRQGYEEKIRAWKFRPVIEDGQPATVSANMVLTLAAVRNDATGTAHFAIERVTFPDPASLTEEAGKAARAGIKRRPDYPRAALQNGMGARVMIVVRTDAQGVPQDMAIEQMLLFGRNPGKDDSYLAQQFERSVRRAAMSWRFPVADASQLVRIPVHYLPPGASARRGGWEQVFAVSRDVPGWLTEQKDGNRPVLELAENGEASSARLQLLTPLDPPLEG